ncbi:MAG: acetylxylan esterase [Acidobacteria bacterium]|jgi:dienelactone hydrolase|nr:acetylxylan esterase [Bryobacteraceae bacterium CoA2 C42]
MRLPALLLMAVSLLAQRPNTNYDESKAPQYPLPALLDGKAWPERRAEILKLYETHVFGNNITAKLPVETTVKAQGPNWREVTFTFSGEGKKKAVNVLIVVPPAAKKRVPAVVCLSFTPISTVLAGHSRWPLDVFAKHGFAVITAHYTDFFPDVKQGRPDSILALLPPDETTNAMSAWAWGMSRMLDYALTQKDLDGKRIAVAGHSRLGKAALWAGATDQRFAAVIANNSGEGGASLSRRIFGEHVADLNANFPHWFTGRFKSYSQAVNDLPVDSHMLLALSAPRPLYVASASEDLWADPLGELLALTEADKAYEAIGAPEQTAYHLRPGKHDITAYDWERYLRFLKAKLR